MKSIQIVGRLTKTPEIKTISSQNGQFKVVNFTVASNDRYSKNKAKTTSFFDCVAFSKTAEFIADRCDKGLLVFVTGEPKNESYQDKDGNPKKHFLVSVDHFSPLEKVSDSKNIANNSNQNNSDFNSFMQNLDVNNSDDEYY